MSNMEQKDISQGAEEILMRDVDPHWQVRSCVDLILEAMQEYAQQERQQEREKAIQEFENILSKIKDGLQQMIQEAPNMLSPDGRFGQRAEDRNHGIAQGAKLALTMVKLIEEKELEKLKQKI